MSNNVRVKKTRQIAIVIHYCNLSLFFWLRRYVLKFPSTEWRPVDYCLCTKISKKLAQYRWLIRYFAPHVLLTLVKHKLHSKYIRLITSNLYVAKTFLKSSLHSLRSRTTDAQSSLFSSKSQTFGFGQTNWTDVFH